MKKVSVITVCLLLAMSLVFVSAETYTVVRTDSGGGSGGGGGGGSSGGGGASSSSSSSSSGTSSTTLEDIKDQSEEQEETVVNEIIEAIAPQIDSPKQLQSSFNYILGFYIFLVFVAIVGAILLWMRNKRNIRKQFARQNQLRDQQIRKYNQVIGVK